ncbi:helix-turn-helix domain-containing protein [Corallococcus macrosporus]|uniref:Transcriptional repressor n=1 Tax=Myxococcus fulvus (strain ATCC BAA-855 / HW-1) TaxID=483219 RepID=F8CCT3_MYXFH|nr:helix-turn-helix transcriptional regulator [Corallococcus macrosporus]AEI63440.1 transcriptional repressor [Corallococcus macrosporus]
MNEKLASTIGKAARVARERLGLTQVEVAGRMDLSPIVYNRLERGRMLPSVSTLVRLCETLEVSPEVLLGHGAPAGRARARALVRDEEPASLHQLTGLARKLDEDQRQALLLLAKLLLR